MSDQKALTPQAVVAAYEKYKTGQRGGGYMAAANWPTALAHDCPAYAVFMRTVPPEQRRPINTSLAMIFSEGNDQGRMVKRDLEDAGFVLSDQESQMVWTKYQISGRMDLKIWKEGFREKINVEVKSCGPIFNSLHTVEDVRDNKNDWVRKWYKQVALYMFLRNAEVYWLLLKSKQFGGIKIIEFKMDDHIANTAEAMIKKAEWVNKLVQIGEMPGANDKLSDADYCAGCEFFDACLPDLTFGPGAVIFSDESVSEMTEQLERRAFLEPLHKEYELIDEELKDVMKSAASEGQLAIVIGNWIANLKEINRKAYEVKATTYKTVKFVKTVR